MTSPYYHQFLVPGDSNPSRSISAPPMLDSNMIFAFPMGQDYTIAFSDIRNDQMYEEFYERYKAKMNIPPPLNEPLHTTQSRKMSQVSDSDDRSRSTSVLVNHVVDTCIKEEDPPSGFTEYSQPNVQDFQPSSYGGSEFYGFTQFNAQHIYTNALDMAKDQIGCRMLQKKLEEQNPFTIQTIYDQIMLQLPILMVDPFGNYLVQKLMEVCDEGILRSIISVIYNEITQISLSPHGTRAVQKLLDIVAKYPNHIQTIVEALKNNVITLIKDINGNHVIQKCLHTLGQANTNFIYEATSLNIIDIGTHRHGCCVLQRCIDAASPRQLDLLVDKIVENAVVLVQDAFGNYVVQYVLDLNSPNINARLAFIFIPYMQKLSTQKFSSNVIEKCLQQNQSEVQQAMIQEIGNPKNLAKMIPDQFANYVVQRALSLAAPLLFTKMMRDIKPLMDDLKRSQFGKKIYSKLMKKYPELADKSNGRGK
ncbi:unnamed protein product [Blepharisma stoltei]|uniref:PUM-HD domain-containing protein n=1 Tax=Blepharisma stoltei TaxID=1481888 RepID=A0AAU9II30_9CILI|nr:unnamed protein product [Blepharisma stoltei]